MSSYVSEIYMADLCTSMDRTVAQVSYLLILLDAQGSFLSPSPMAITLPEPVSDLYIHMIEKYRTRWHLFSFAVIWHRVRCTNDLASRHIPLHQATPGQPRLPGYSSLHPLTQNTGATASRSTEYWIATRVKHDLRRRWLEITDTCKLGMTVRLSSSVLSISLSRVRGSFSSTFCNHEGKFMELPLYMQHSRTH
jgi:hypothetical protein